MSKHQINKSRIVKIVSGGQTGADRGGLDAAIELNISYGGWCPKGRKAEDGIIPEKYNMQELDSYEYIKRTEKNVIDSTATVIFCYGAPEGGSLKTVEFAELYLKPYLIVDMNISQKKIESLFIEWVKGLANGSIILNVAGSRSSLSPTLQYDVYNILKKTIKQL